MSTVIVGDDFDHSFHSHEYEFNEVDPCPKEINAQIELTDGLRNFIFTSKNAKLVNDDTA